MTLREDYNRDGYVKVENLVTPNIPLDSWNETWFRQLFEDGVEYYVPFVKMLANQLLCHHYFINEDVEDIIDILGLESPVVPTLPVFHVMSPALRIPDGYYGTAAHQDWPSTQGSLDCVTVWVALTDAGIGDFPLEVIPGSHKWGLLDGVVNGSVLEIGVNDRDLIPLECKAGDVVFMSGFLVHRTGQGNGFRIAVSQRFDNAAEPTFIERGYPCAQKRVVDREIRWKPSIEQVRAIYGVD